ncbi:MAG TPA: S-layer homology domain-containing protein, partial [Thermoanaerobaculia bacterium]|nr:S-layer homology domain-containing protein [Thermoanaerobaculia bacterium]
SVDGESAAGTSSNVNGVLEPGETVELAPSWTNNGSGAASFAGSLTGLAGPAGASYAIADGSAGYAIAAGATGSCGGSSSGCYRISVSNPASRPAAHWDATATEKLSDGSVRKWKVHVGRSFGDVAPSEAFYGAIETLFHSGVTTGCAVAAYCPNATVARGQIAAFVARAAFGSDAALPTAGFVPGVGAYACRSGGVSLFGDVLPSDPFCRQIHWLAAGGRSFSCDEQPSYGSTWCPASPVTRGSFAEILARDLSGSDAAVPASLPDPGNGRAYDCTDGQPNAFPDVGDADPLCRYVYFIWSRGVIDGFGDGTYRPADTVLRDQMAKFLVNAYALP